MRDAILWRRQGPLQVYKKRKTGPVCSCQWQAHMCGLRFHLQILPDSQDALICEQQQKSMQANPALGESLGLSFSEAHEK